MLEVFKNKCLRRILHIFWPNKIPNASSTFKLGCCLYLYLYDRLAHLVRGKEKQMEMEWPCEQNATDINSKSSHALDPRRKLEAGTTKRDAENVRGARYGVGARSQSWQRTEQDGVPRCRPYVRASTKRTK